MVDFSEVRSLFPLVSFFFVRLGAFLETSSGQRPHIDLFVSRDSAFRPVLIDLYPLLHRSLNWYRLLYKMSMEEGERSVVRSSELETVLSSSDKPVEMEIDTVALKPLSLKPSFSKPSSSTKLMSFHVLKEPCGLNEETLFRFKDRFQFPNETKICLPHENKKACVFAHGKVCFYKATFLSGLRFLIHPFIMELFHCLNIAPGQLMPNSWWTIISCMAIWLIINNGDMIKMDEFLYLYRFKESKQFGYYELMP